GDRPRAGRTRGRCDVSRRCRGSGRLSAPPPLLFGSDPTPGLVAASLTDEGRGMRLWRRDGDRLRTEVVPFAPFLLVADTALVSGAPGLTALAELAGPGALRWLARFASWGEALGARDRCRNSDAPVVVRFLADPLHQYLLQSGRTSFGGMRYGDLRRLALDIEVVTTDGYEFPSATRAGDRIVAIALADSAGFREVLRGDRMEEGALLAECGRLIRERDPDTIEGHNIFRFDLEYLEARAGGRRDCRWPSAPSASGVTRSRGATSSTHGCSPSCTTSARVICRRSA